MSKTKNIHVRCDEALDKKIDAAAVKRGVAKSKFVRDAVEKAANRVLKSNKEK